MKVTMLAHVDAELRLVGHDAGEIQVFISVA
jgi:hypothetical protein